MYHLNMDLDVRRDVEGAPCVRDYLAGREGDPTPVVDPPQARAAQDQALPASRNDGRRYVRTNFPESSRVRDNDISTWQDSGVHDSPAIVRGNVLGQDFRHRGPIAFGEVHLVVLI